MVCSTDLYSSANKWHKENLKSVIFQFTGFPASEKKELPSTSEFSKRKQASTPGRGKHADCFLVGRVGKLIRQPISGQKRQKRLRYIQLFLFFRLNTEREIKQECVKVTFHHCPFRTGNYIMKCRWHFLKYSKIVYFKQVASP